MSGLGQYMPSCASRITDVAAVNGGLSRGLHGSGGSPTKRFRLKSVSDRSQTVFERVAPLCYCLLDPGPRQACGGEVAEHELGLATGAGWAPLDVEVPLWKEGANPCPGLGSIREWPGGVLKPL